jgi:hypothetical protein
MSNSAACLQHQPPAGDFQKSQTALACSTAPQILKFERADWSLFRTVEGLQHRAGVAKADLPKLVMKELVDNGLDEGEDTTVSFGGLPSGAYFVTDDGRGIDGTPEDVARLFSISRPMVSTKLLRLPTRGALGNGLRVVAGAVLASEGSLVVITRAQRIALRPERDGTTTVVSAEPVAHANPLGTRIEIAFGPALPCNGDIFSWARLACDLAGHGSTYRGGSSSYWYDAAQFHELLYAAGSTPVREFIANLDGCTGGKAGEIVAEAGLVRVICTDVSRDQVRRLLTVARKNTRQVQPRRLGSIGPEANPSAAYACSFGTVQLGSAEPFAEIPFVIEAWGRRIEHDKTVLIVSVNRTPVSGSIHAARDGRDIDLFGCGLHHTIARAPKDEQFAIILNVTVPYMPITSDGKAPDLEPFVDGIAEVAEKAVRKAHRPNSSGVKSSQKEVVLDNLDAAIASVSGDGTYRFNERQVFYVLREVIMKATGQELKINNFKTIITDYEAENGEIPLMYREPRGSIYHPHRGETVVLGTLAVESYERPAWTFNKIVYFEKEGWSEALKDDRWPECHDCVLLSSKGFSTRAARDLVDKLAEHDEPVAIFCVHDADAAGTMIYQTFQEATKAREARKIKIVNLGLEPWEAVAMGLSVENVEAGERRKPVADYVREREDGEYWEEWLQSHRIELNAMSTPRFIEWLDEKMANYEKLIPPEDVLSDELDQCIEENVRSKIMDRILRETGFEDQVAIAISNIDKPDAADLTKGIKTLFEREEDREWRDHIKHVADLKIRDVE